MGAVAEELGLRSVKRWKERRERGGRKGGRGEKRKGGPWRS
jgi:hypothetical protein